MRLSAYLGLSLLLLALAGCGGSNASTSSETTRPDTTNPPGDGDDNGGGDSGGDGDGGDDDGGNDNGGGDTGTPPPDCAFTDPVAPVVSETLGNTNDTGAYALENYAERTDLNTDLTGTWVMVHRQTKFDFNSEENARDTLQVWQKSVFIIRDNGGTLEAGSCNNGGFSELIIDDDQLNLPLFGGVSGVPAFELVQGSQSALAGINLTSGGRITYSNQFTGAIKVSDSVTPLGQSSITIGAGSDNNAEIVCVTQKRELSMKQVCAQPAPTPSVMLSVILATTNSAPEPTSNRHGLTFNVNTISSQHGLLSEGKLLLQPNVEDIIEVIQANNSGIVLSLDITDGYLCTSLLNCNPGNTGFTGSLTFTANLPGAVPAP